MLKQAWCNKQDLITQPGNRNDSRARKHLRKDEGECKYLTLLVSSSAGVPHKHTQCRRARQKSWTEWANRTPLNPIMHPKQQAYISILSSMMLNVCQRRTVHVRQRFQGFVTSHLGCFSPIEANTHLYLTGKMCDMCGYVFISLETTWIGDVTRYSTSRKTFLKWGLKTGDLQICTKLLVVKGLGEHSWVTW